MAVAEARHITAEPLQLEDTILLTADEEDVHHAMLTVCNKVLPGWDHLSVTDVEASYHLWLYV